MVKKGIFITFEGSEGCGKSTQSKLLVEYLLQKKHRVVFVREPGATLVGEQIRALLLNPQHTGMSRVCEMLLYMAARAQITEEVILPALAQGKIVISDRYLDSTLAYQGYGLGMDIAAIKAVGRLATQKLSPDLTIFLDLPVKAGLRHRRTSRDRIEQRPLAYHTKVRKGYLALARRESGRIKVVRVQADPQATQHCIRTLLERYV